MGDPYAVLGVESQASPEELASAYRELAKRHHPDVAGDDGERMRAINAAYAAVSQRRSERAGWPGSGSAHAGGGGADSVAAPRTAAVRSAPAPGAWLPPDTRRQLGRELLDALSPQEEVLVVADASTWDSPTIRLVATDRRLLWLRDDAPVARVRFLPYAMLEGADGRVSRRRRQGELRIKPRDARRISFAAMRPEALQATLREIGPRLPSPHRSPRSAAAASA